MPLEKSKICCKSGFHVQETFSKHHPQSWFFTPPPPPPPQKKKKLPAISYIENFKEYWSEGVPNY